MHEGDSNFNFSEYFCSLMFKKNKTHWSFLFFHLFVETKRINIQAAAVYFNLAVSVQRLSLKHSIRYVAKNMVGQCRSNAIMQQLSGSRSMFLTPKTTSEPHMHVGNLKTCCGQI